MLFRHSIINTIAYYEYKELLLLGVQGNLEFSLHELSELLKDSAMDFAPVKQEYSRDFLGVFCFEPAIDITLVRFPNTESSIVLYGLYKNESQIVLDKIIRRSGFISKNPDDDFLMCNNVTMAIELTTYEECSQLSHMMNVEFKNLYNTARYSNFLSRYKKYSEEQALRIALEQFNIRV